MLDFVEINGFPVMVFKGERKWLAGCPHKRRPLRNSEVRGDVIRCPFHGAEFDLNTGRLVRPPESKTSCPEDCSLIEVKVENGEVKFSREPFVPSLPRGQ
ncbi:Rieske (2Fe-2S) protein [Metallosphaera hakonensis]|uniref:(2Fe-2S)-binding protein n=1 Tax=Metallosphaera hakonensis JCM 8857 = DSM 7519 TaxID=1293036 RepID=A0A2U9ISQ2_9CREN|nr:Rieske 2Fe-2S domain-containing protein [Metallosphaera hakonensis]AWR99056.1 Rieske 2Fe-2S domain-containing protein [Metallosphaera hakonensis JCM 8857 = DSM 7519]